MAAKNHHSQKLWQWKKAHFFLRRNAETNECTPPTTHKQSGKLIQLINILKGDKQLRLHYHHDNLKPHKLHYLWSQEGEMNWKGGFENLPPPPLLRVPLFSETDSRKGEAARAQELPRRTKKNKCRKKQIKQQTSLLQAPVCVCSSRDTDWLALLLLQRKGAMELV
jgi:hypothetical protein